MGHMIATELKEENDIRKNYKRLLIMAINDVWESCFIAVASS